MMHHSCHSATHYLMVAVLNSALLWPLDISIANLSVESTMAHAILTLCILVVDLTCCYHCVVQDISALWTCLRAGSTLSAVTASGSIKPVTRTPATATAATAAAASTAAASKNSNASATSQGRPRYVYIYSV
jgi:hypothetical protein